MVYCSPGRILSPVPSTGGKQVFSSCTHLAQKLELYVTLVGFMFYEAESGTQELFFCKPDTGVRLHMSHVNVRVQRPCNDVVLPGS